MGLLRGWGGGGVCEIRYDMELMELMHDKLCQFGFSSCWW